MRVIGTAGHVDHGKSTLIAALTGVHPDRLREEREREMTIELGFGWMKLPMALPGGESAEELVGIVDVPGHRDFIDNMLAGVGGIDAALFVVAADEGVMPQTREHLAILDLLGISGGVIALTKTDLTPDRDWVELVAEDVREGVRGTVLQEAAIVPVSARKGSGLGELRTALAACLASRPSRPDLGRPRLPVDRVFSMTGFGTVVTGTLLDGTLRLGDEVQLLPGTRRARVRGLQAFGRKVDSAPPGSRTAVNLTGVDVDDLRRGMTLALSSGYQSTRRLDVIFRLLPDAGVTLRHDDEVKFHFGAGETTARVRLLGAEEIAPGQNGWLQLELREPVVAVRGDRFILRRPSPSETLGGGEVLDAQPLGRHRRFDAKLLDRLAFLQRGDPRDLLLQSFRGGQALTLAEAGARSGLESGILEALLPEMVVAGELVMLEDGKPGAGAELLALSRDAWLPVREKLLRELEGFHRANPLRQGLGREELRSRSGLSPRVFQAVVGYLERTGEVTAQAGIVRLAGHRVKLDAKQQAAASALLDRFAAAPNTPPSLKESQAEAGELIVQALIDAGELVQLSPEVLYRKEDYQRLTDRVLAHFRTKPTLSVAELRDQLGASRKYVLALLEHFDKIGLTRREGDTRTMRGSRGG